MEYVTPSMVRIYRHVDTMLWDQVSNLHSMLFGLQELLRLAQPDLESNVRLSEVENIINNDNAIN